MEILKKLPEIIQGGMGIAVSNWTLAKTVSQQGQLGVVSGTAIDNVFTRRLELGDLDGSVRRALSHFPWQDMVQGFLDKYFIEGGKDEKARFKPNPMPSINLTKTVSERMILSNFVEVFLAKEGHDGLVGVNYLEKIQLPTLPSCLGAMLAGVDFILMGAGIPLAIPGVLDGISKWEEVELKISVEDNPDRHDYVQKFDPKAFCGDEQIPLTRPQFLAIISSDIVAKSMERKASGYVDGYIVENHTAGGHNAPPRKVGPEGVPQSFGPKDEPNLKKIKDLGKPFWIAGGFASEQGLKYAKNEGATGIQAGTAFAYCNESGIIPSIKEKVIAKCLDGTLNVYTDFKASPTGYPFKVIEMEETLTDPKTYEERQRVCDLGYLRQIYSKDEEKAGYRCSAEPIANYIKSGGTEAGTLDKQCLCNGLMATIGLGQIRKDGNAEPPIITSGEDFSSVENLVKKHNGPYSAKNAIDYILG